MTPTTTEPHIWTELLVFLDRDGMSQATLARATGISPSYLNDMIRGRRAVTGRARKAIAATLRVPQSMLIPRESDTEEYTSGKDRAAA